MVDGFIFGLQLAGFVILRETLITIQFVSKF